MSSKIARLVWNKRINLPLRDPTMPEFLRLALRGSALAQESEAELEQKSDIGPELTLVQRSNRTPSNKQLPAIRQPVLASGGLSGCLP